MEDLAVWSQYLKLRADALVANLEKRNIRGYYAATAEAGKEQVLSLIPLGAQVVFAGSQTLEQIGVKPVLRTSDQYQLIDPYEPGIEPAEGIARRKRGLTADVMVCGTNAITEDGVLVNVDGLGNRTAGMIFGPDKVVVAVGMNKVVPGVHEAFKRLEAQARPMNSMRLELKTPCVTTGFCEDCSSPGRICNYFTIIERSFINDRLHVVLIGQDLGY